jgi:phage-related baseplate assembly protein
MPAVNPFQNLPPISFANCDVVALTNAIVAAFQNVWNQATGETLVLSQADRRYQFLLALTGYFVAAFNQLDASLKQDLLPFSSGGFLDNIVAIFGPRALRLPVTPATADILFTLQNSATSVVTIPAGTQVADTSGTGLIFQTTAALSILPGALTGQTQANCTSTGPVSPPLIPNTITNILNPPVLLNGNVITAANPEVAIDGTEPESDDAYRARIYTLVTDSYSNAGSYGAYQYFAESADTTISQVSVLGPESGLVSPGNVLVTVLCQNGQFPNSSVIQNVQNALSPNDIRPLTDNVIVQAPSGVPFTVNISYFIPEEDVSNTTNIQAEVNVAVEEVITEITTTLGADIDPSAFTAAVQNAGGINVVVIHPAVFKGLNASQIPSTSGVPTLTYLGTD